jgi:hypothetical protein
MLMLKFIGLGAVCLGLGIVGGMLAFSTQMYGPEQASGGTIMAAIFIVIGTCVSGLCAYFISKNWALWAMLIGSPAAIFTLYHWFIVPSTRPYNVAKACALAFLIIPLIGGYIGKNFRLKKETAPFSSKIATE